MTAKGFLINQPYILILCLFAFSTTYSAAKDNTIDWKLINNKKNIEVYSAEVADSDILKIKTQTRMQASIAKIQSVLDNVKQRSNWVPYLQQSSVIENISATQSIEYSLFAAPWPASDRDFVYRRTQISNTESVLVYEMTSLQHPHKPVSEQIIRASLMESTYILTALSAHETQVELIFYADPKGWLPNWIINIINRMLPYLILKNLRDLVTQH